MLPILISAINPEDKKEFFTNLYRTYYSLMARTAYQTASVINVGDTVQDALVRLLRHYEKLRGMNETQLAGYSALTVKSAAIDALRKHYQDTVWSYYGPVEDFADLAPDFQTPEQLLIRKEERASRIHALNSLPAAQRDLLFYKYVLEMPNRKLAEIYGTTEPNIRQMLSRTRRKLCALLEGSK